MPARRTIAVTCAPDSHYAFVRQVVYNVLNSNTDSAIHLKID